MSCFSCRRWQRSFQMTTINLLFIVRLEVYRMKINYDTDKFISGRVISPWKNEFKWTHVYSCNSIIQRLIRLCPCGLQVFSGRTYGKFALQTELNREKKQVQQIERGSALCSRRHVKSTSQCPSLLQLRGKSPRRLEESDKTQIRTGGRVSA